MKKLVKNNKGFTLAELIIAAGISGVIGLVAITTLKNTKQASNITVVNSEVTTLKSLIVAQLITPSGCRKTFPPGTLITRPTNVEILSPTGAVIAKAGLQFGPTREFSITQIGTSSSGASSNILKIKIDYQLKAKLDKPGKKNYSFDIDIFVNKNDAKDEITACFIDIAGGAKKAIEASCRGLGAVYNSTVLPYGTCTHNLPEIRNQAGAKMVTNLCPPGEYLQKIAAETAPNKIILQCKKFIIGPCGPWSYVNKVNGTTGAADCVSLSTFYNAGQVITTMNTKTPTYQAVDLNCTNADQVVRSIKSDGTPECIPKHIAKACGPNEYVYDITKVSDEQFTVNCRAFTKASAGACAVGEYLQAVNSDGTIPPGGCVTQTLPATCAAGNVMTGLNSSGGAICQANP